MAANMTLVLGGVRSGKSGFAEQLVRSLDKPTMYVATGQVTDEEMARRIQRHRQSRPPGWATLEVPLELADGLEMALSLPGAPQAVLLDSLDGWVSNLLLAHETDAAAEVESLALAQLDQVLTLCARSPADFMLVSSEVGLTLVPPYPLGRRFQDLLGLVNQKAAAAAGRVYLVVAGVALPVKGGDAR